LSDSVKIKVQRRCR